MASAAAEKKWLRFSNFGFLVPTNRSHASCTNSVGCNVWPGVSRAILLAASKMARETPGQTLQPTELVHEAWLRLVGSANRKFENRAHFFSAAAEAMRRILIDRARRKLTQRHGGGVERVDLDGQDLASPEVDEQLLAVHEVLDKFAKDHPVQAEVVKLRYFVGMTNEETAQVLGISVSSVNNYWMFSRTWILHEIKNA